MASSKAAARLIVRKKPPDCLDYFNCIEAQPTASAVVKRIVHRKPALSKGGVTETMGMRDFESDIGLADHVQTDTISNCLVDTDITRLLRALYNNDKAPHNKCVRYSLGQFMIYTGGRWTNMPLAKVIRDLVETAYRLLRVHFNNKPETVIAAFENRGREPNMYKIECWLEDLWDGALDEHIVHKAVIAAFS